MGLYAYNHDLPKIALWSFKNSEKDSPFANKAGIYQAEGETLLLLGEESEAVQRYLKSLKYNPKNAYVYGKIGKT
jgi:hypothetical protein